MFVIESKEEFTALLESSLEKVMNQMQENETILSGWDKIVEFLGIGKHQIRMNYDAGVYGDALQIRGRSVLLNTKRLWEVMKEREM